MRRFFILAILALLLSSCSQENFGSNGHETKVASETLNAPYSEAVPYVPASPLPTPAHKPSPVSSSSPSPSIHPSPSHKTVIADDEWSPELINEYCADGTLCNRFSFTFESTEADVINELGSQTSNPEEEFLCKEYGDIWVFYSNYSKHPVENVVIGVTLQNGEKCFGLETGVSTIEDAEIVMGVPYSEMFDLLPFVLGSSSEDINASEPDDTYMHFTYFVHTSTIQLYFTEGVLQTVYIYNPRR